MIEPTTTRASVIYASATAEQVAEGAAWYATARRDAAVLARRHGVTVDRAAAVIAALSPANMWKGNLTMADRLLADPAGYGARLCAAHRPAVAIADGTQHRCEPATAGPGLKVKAFCAAIRSGGRKGRAVVDRWMLRALGVGTGDSVTPAQYNAAADALQRAADLHGVPVHALQATVWIATRGEAF